MKPLITLATPTYNRAAFLGKTVNSGLAQRYPNFEYVIVDDGSTDDTESVVLGFNDSRIRYFRKEHSGAPLTRNRCVQEARGDFLLWLDSDDVLYPGVITHYAELLNCFPDVDILYGDLDMLDEAGGRSKLEFQDYYLVPNLLAKLIRGTIIPNPGSLVRKALYTLHGDYDVSFRRAHDFEFWSRALKTATIKHSGITSCEYAWHRGNLSMNAVDLSFEAGVVKKLCHANDLSLLFPELDWRKSIASFQAWTKIGKLLSSCNDSCNTKVAFQNAVAVLPIELSTIARNAFKREIDVLLEDLVEHNAGELEIHLEALDSHVEGSLDEAILSHTNTD